jgi:hypothetical protein
LQQNQERYSYNRNSQKKILKSERNSTTGRKILAAGIKVLQQKLIPAKGKKFLQ